jgi:peroxiredoxin
MKINKKITEIVAWSVAGVVLVGALGYYNFIDKAPESGVKQGNRCPDFTAQTYAVDGDTFYLDGEFTLSEQIGKVVVVNFWATWCPPCREELKQVQKQLIDRFKGKDFLFLPISRGEKKDVVEAFRKKNNYTFPMGLDPEQSIYKLYASNYIPRNFVVGKDGKVIYVSVGYTPEEFAEMIKVIEGALK